MNTRLLTTINGWSGNPVIDAIMRFAAQYLIFVVFAVLAVLVVVRLIRRELWPVVQALLTLVVAFLVGLVAAAVHPELRPFQTHDIRVLVVHAPGQSFPSDHSTAAFAIALAVLAFLSWRWGIVLLLAAALIGFARVYDGIHYPGDILGSILVALVSLGIVGVASRVLPMRRPAAVGDEPMA